MLTLEIAAPTLNRPERLARMLASLEHGGYPYRTHISHETMPRPLPVCVNELFGASDADVVLMAADDVEFLPGCLAEVMDAFTVHFPDLDGYVGLNMCNHVQEPGLSEFAFFAAGRTFMDRFPGRQLFCPDYWHFHSDTELGLYAQAVGKFYWAESARLHHHNPTWQADPVDDTHKQSRAKQLEDIAINKRRKAKGLLWGLSWERVT